MKKRMRILWICNQMLPAVARKLGLTASNKEGWISGLVKQVTEKQKECEIELGVCFPIPESLHSMYESEDAEGKALFRGECEGFSYFGFREDTVNLHFYDFKVEHQLKLIMEEFQPDILHIFGTEYPHALAAAKAFKNPSNTLVGIQGVMSACAEFYLADIPEKIAKRYTLRDFLKRDNILEQQEKFYLRAEYEKQLLRITGHVTGRTQFDKEEIRKVNPSCEYHFMNETMRSNFYDGEKWDIAKCKRHSIFVSQGNYPLKGLHKVIEALAIVRKVYPDAVLNVTGDCITGFRTIKEKLKISSYGYYLLELLKEYQCRGAVQFLGKADAEQMKEQYLRAHVLVSASSVENSSNSIGEAMLLGVPIVSSYVGGIPSLMTDEKEGLFYKFPDANALARKIMRIFQEDELAESLSKAAKERGIQLHNPQKNFERLLEIYHAIDVCI